MLGTTVKKLSPEFNDVLLRLENEGGNFFITGKAGTGKSTLLQMFRNTTKKKVVVLAPTGIAALNVKGQTIHSFFGLPPKLLLPADIKRSRRHKMYKKLEAVIIDEISMVRADVFDAINLFLQINREDARPFGGVQMILFGDLFQLPPVVASNSEKQYFSQVYESPYFFSSQVMKSGWPLELYELRKVYRQDDPLFIRLLDRIRTNRIDEEDLQMINERHTPYMDKDDLRIILSARNAKVDLINNERIKMLDQKPKTYPAKIKGKFQRKFHPTEEILILKKGAQVMFIKNDPTHQYVNGTLGTVTNLDKEEIEIKTERGKVVTIERAEWEIIEYRFNSTKGSIESRVVGTFIQFPLKLAWAMTIHKSQGKTFDKVMVDLGYGAFAHGQTYVALSRCRTLDGILLKEKIQRKDIMVDEKIVDFQQMYFA